jgi:hypothetical protein
VIADQVSVTTFCRASSRLKILLFIAVDSGSFENFNAFFNVLELKMIRMERSTTEDKAVFQVVDEAATRYFSCRLPCPPHDRRPIRAETRATLVAAIARGCSTLVTVPAIISSSQRRRGINAAFDKSI